MSVDYNVRVGAYLRVWVPVERTDRDRCEGHEHGGGNFCAQCGLTSERRIVVDESRADDGYYEAHLDGRLGTWDADVKIDPKYDWSGEHEVPDKAAAMGYVESHYAPEIEWLRARGCRVEVRFGILNWTY